MSITWIAGNANALVVEAARNNLRKGRPYIRSATVTAVIVDDTDTQITGVTQPVTLEEITGLPGWYGCAIPDTANITAGQSYTAQVTFTGAGDNEDAYREEAITVEAP